MQDEGADLIPGVPESEIKSAVQDLLKLPAIPLEDKERFFVAIRSLAESRAQSGWPSENSEDVAVFLLAQYPRKVGEPLGAKPVTDPIATEDAILGRLFFLNRDASSGRVMPLPTSPNEILEWLEDQGLQDLPVVIVYRHKKLMVSRSMGSASDARREVIRDKPPVGSLDEVLEALVMSHKDLFLTPSVCPPGIWEPERSAQYIPGERPEKAIQRELATVLYSWFHGVLKAEMEDSISVGRIDIRLLRPDEDGNLSYWVILELKVIKSNHNAKKPKKPTAVTETENAEAIAEGIRQASSFAKNRNAEPLLEIYDLRKDKSTDLLKHSLVAEQLGKCELKPTCRLWPLYGSASDARDAGY